MLCSQWRVRDVVAHIISYDELDSRDLLAHVIQGRFRLDRINALAMARYSTCSPEQLLALLTADSRSILDHLHLPRQPER